MTTRQLKAVEDDYSSYVHDSWKVSSCETRYTTRVEDKAKLRCAVCNCRLGEAETLKEITWVATHPQGLRHIKAIVCRNGVACRRRAAAA